MNDRLWHYGIYDNHFPKNSFYNKNRMENDEKSNAN